MLANLLKLDSALITDRRQFALVVQSRGLGRGGESSFFGGRYRNVCFSVRSSDCANFRRGRIWRGGRLR